MFHVRESDTFTVEAGQIMGDRYQASERMTQTCFRIADFSAVSALQTVLKQRKVGPNDRVTIKLEGGVPTLLSVEAANDTLATIVAPVEHPAKNSAVRQSPPRDRQLPPRRRRN